MSRKNVFRLRIQPERIFSKGEILTAGDGTFKVISLPGKTMFRSFLKWITFSKYKIPVDYKVKLLKTKENG